ncbi:branched-chain amino acid ABC transporter ATP-binding protein/permease [Roseomonas sp. GC11]|uniref:branched-chain amino acid ABC transporter ATP-binding protein/permease n=1 Tax=Roseomonas sp. GC11 TaxID=2950546 RepID=UPI0021096EF8|nr:branched-chain amino acid ABC transporter ATP-binding protein/permease [Roseomonas sp. GC11]MCQ4160023.1 branched-chain amino acid ABC transporter ATP-binding protein/permease [Roseomonas sp. GC11]
MPHRLLLPLLAALALLPLLPGFPPFWVTLLCYAGLAALVALGLVVLTGVAGLTSFGQAIFVGFGAYASAILTTRHGVSPWAALPAALLAAGVMAALIGALTLRLRGHYLAIATIAWNVSFYYLAANLDLTQRNDGISGIPPLRLGETALTEARAFYPLVLLCLGLALLATRNLLDSRVGRAIRALRGGALAAESFGVDTYRAKLLAFIYAGLLAGLSGWLYAHLQRAVNPSPFSLTMSIDYLLMAVAGGVQHLGGALLGALLVTLLRDQLQSLLPALLGAQGNFESIVFGLALVMLLQGAPQGLWPLLMRPFARWNGPRAAATPPPAAAPLPQRARPAPGTEILRAEDLQKRFGGLVAVNGVGFHLEAGEVVGLIGPNGAGKSTTFNLLTGVLAPTRGAVRFLGTPIAGLPARRIATLGIARSFQHVKLVHGMSVLENVALGAHLRGRAGALRAALRLDRAEEARLLALAWAQIERVGLAAVAHLPADSLALGQQRLVEIARALCLDPVLLLLDEPAAGLRHLEKAALSCLLDRLRAEGMTILLVEHDMDFVMSLTDRLVVMNFGAELAQGRPREIQRNPAVIDAYLGSAA